MLQKETGTINNLKHKYDVSNYFYPQSGPQKGATPTSQFLFVYSTFSWVYLNFSCPPLLRLSTIFFGASPLFLFICQIQLDMFLCNFAHKRATPCLSLNFRFLIIFILVCPNIQLNILISATFIFRLTNFFTSQHSILYNNACLMATR